MGYSALQIPDLIRLVSRHFTKYIGKKRSFIHNVVPYTTKIQITEVFSANMNHFSTPSNPNSEVLQRIKSELENISRRIDSLEKFTLKMNDRLEDIV